MRLVMLRCTSSCSRCRGRAAAPRARVPAPKIAKSTGFFMRPSAASVPAQTSTVLDPTLTQQQAEGPATSFFSSFQAALSRKPALLDDIASITARPFVAGPVEALTGHPVMTELATEQPQVAAQLQELVARVDLELTSAQAKWAVKMLSVVTTHPAIYSALSLTEAIFDNERVAAASSTLDRVITHERVAWAVGVLHDTFTPVRIRKAASLLQFLATEQRVRQWMDVVDTIGKDNHVDHVKAWADAVVVALEKGLVVRVLDSLQASLPKDRVLRAAAALDTLITETRVEAFGNVLDGVLTPARVDGALGTLDELDTPDRLARMGPALRALGDLGTARMSAITSAASYFLGHPACAALLHLVDNVMVGDRAAKWAVGLEAALTPARVAWLVDAQAAPAHDAAKVKVAEETLLFGLVTRELLADEQALKHGLDMLAGVLLTPPHIRKFIATVDFLLEPRRAALWANAIEDILVPLLPPPMLLSQLQCYASCGVPPGLGSPTSAANTTAVPSQLQPHNTTAVPSQLQPAMPVADVHVRESSGAATNIPSGIGAAEVVTAEPGISSLGHEPASGASTAAVSTSSEDQDTAAEEGLLPLGDAAQLVKRVVSERTKAMGALAQSWLIPTTLRFLDAMLPIHRVKLLLKAMDSLLASPQVLCELRALVMFAHRAANPGTASEHSSSRPGAAPAGTNTATTPSMLSKSSTQAQQQPPPVVATHSASRSAPAAAASMPAGTNVGGAISKGSSAGAAGAGSSVPAADPAPAISCACPAAPVDPLACDVRRPQSLVQRWAQLLWRLHIQLAIERSVAKGRPL